LAAVQSPAGGPPIRNAAAGVEPVQADLLSPPGRR
jgi:hypothetical protein